MYFLFKELTFVDVVRLLFHHHIFYAPQTNAPQFAEHPLAMDPIVDFLVEFYRILTVRKEEYNKKKESQRKST